jgi:hypothetical protein
MVNFQEEGQFLDDFEMEELIRQCYICYFENLEYPHPLCSTVKQSVRNKFFIIISLQCHGMKFPLASFSFSVPPLHLDSQGPQTHDLL